MASPIHQFTKPTHLMHPVLPNTISIGHNECPARTTDTTIAIASADVRERTKIMLILVLAKQAQQIVISLLDTHGRIIFNFTIQPDSIKFGPDYVKIN